MSSARDDTRPPSQHPPSPRSTSAPPSFIQLPPNTFDADSAFASPSAFFTPPVSPPIQFYTAPSSPYASPQPENVSVSVTLIPTPPIALRVPLDVGIARPQTPPPPIIPPDPHAPLFAIDSPVLAEPNEIYPSEALATELVHDLTLDNDDSLTPLERIYLFSQSTAAFHRVFIAHALPALLTQISIHEAIQYVLPLLPGLAMDEDEAVKEAFAAELVHIIWYFFSHAYVIEDESSYPGDPSLLPSVSVQSFTPILGTFLLSSNPLVGGPARYTVVDLLARIRRADDGFEDAGLFGSPERRLFEQEIIHQVVIGMGRLDPSVDEDVPMSSKQGTGEVNPYFPQTPESHPHSTEEEDAQKEQAAVGRLSSMSLMAAVVASDSNIVDEETKTAFVNELERVGRDSVYWVRREACFALGALAKVVPYEVVMSSLLPLFKSLRQDSSHHVRHSALFALPGLLLRLPYAQRRTLALETVPALAEDGNATVRSGVLEALGEVIYAFSNEKGQEGEVVPEELVRLFVGWNGDKRRQRDRQAGKAGSITDGDQLSMVYGAPQDHGMNAQTSAEARLHGGGSPIAMSASPAAMKEAMSPLELFYTDPARPLVCAFNIPAVALTLGRARWERDLRPLYISLSSTGDVKIRRTLTASAGELAKIIGPTPAERDILPIWKSALVFRDDKEVRMKAIESTKALLEALQGAARTQIGKTLEEAWTGLTNWREREGVVRVLEGLVASEDISPREIEVVRRLVRGGLQDKVSAVRETAVDALPRVWAIIACYPNMLQGMKDDVRNLARSPNYRRRMTFVACVQQLVLTDREDDIDGRLWDELFVLTSDAIAGVRIGVARFVGVMYDKHAMSPPSQLNRLVQQLSQDKAHEVRQYILPNTGQVVSSETRPATSRSSTTSTSSSTSSSSATFSRPPPPDRNG